MTTAASRKTALSLFRALSREAKQMNDYNFRSYAMRRVKTGFQMNASLQGEQEVIDALKDGEEQLQMLKRQRIIGNLYPSDVSVMEANS
mmetsp:Transcript_12650/g.16040  ORF Transcript_12650/g.16040 Transcript_12650/m.16040 type:complete len:89 (+) Transcript_12650:36-302(+)